MTKKKLQIFLRWLHNQRSLTSEEWGKVTPEEVFEPSQPTPEFVVKSAPSADVVAEFKRGIKRSVSDYKDLTNDSKWKSFKNHLLNMAATHDVGEVLDKNYKPKSFVEEKLFKKKQNFVFSVFRDHLQTSKTMKVVQEHAKTNDAQKIFQALVEMFEGGTAAQLEEERAEDQLKVFKLTES